MLKKCKYFLKNSNKISNRYFNKMTEIQLPLVAYIIKIENLPTFSGKKTDKLIGFCVVDLLRNHLQMFNLRC